MVIPAPIAYVKVVAVKKLVVGFGALESAHLSARDEPARVFASALYAQSCSSQAGSYSCAQKFIASST